MGRRYTGDDMESVTLTADEHLLKQARAVAQSQNKTLDDAFREWLEQYTARAACGKEYDALMERLRYLKSEGPYTRDEMNER